MTLTLQCGCGRKLAAPDTQAGKRGTCGGCGRIHQLPLSPAEPQPSSPAPPPPKSAQPWLSKLFSGRSKLSPAADRSARIAQSLTALQSPSPELWPGAIEDLAGLGDETAVQAILSLASPPLEPLFCAVQSESSDQRRIAAGVLGKLKHPWAVDALLWAIEHPLIESRVDWTVGDEETNEPGQTNLYAVDYLYAALREMGNVAADRLLKFLEPSERCSFAVIEAIRHLRDDRAIPRLVTILKEGGPSQRLWAEEALSHLNWRPTSVAEMQARRWARSFGAADWEQLRRLEAGTVSSVAAYFIKCLQVAEHDDNSPSAPNWRGVARTLGNPVPQKISREKAVGALGGLRDSSAVAPLISCADVARREARAEIDKYAGNPQTKAYVARRALEFQFQIGAALAKIGDRRATAFLLQLLEENPEGPCSRILEHVGPFQDPRFLPLLQRDLREASIAFHRRQLIRAMAQLGDPRAVKTLVAILEDSRSSEVHLDAIVALGQLGCTDHPELEKARKSKDRAVKYAAFVALGRTKDAISAMKSSGDCDATAALARSQDEQAVPALIEMLTDTRNGVQYHAARSLRALGWKPATLEQAITFGILSDDVELLVDQGTAAVPALLDRCPESNVALQALALFPTRSAEEPLLCALTNADKTKRKLAAELLRDFPGDVVVGGLRSAIANERVQEIASVMSSTLKKLEGSN